MTTMDILLNGQRGTWYEVRTSLGLVKIFIEIKQCYEEIKYFDISEAINHTESAKIMEEMINDAIINNKEYTGFQNNLGRFKVTIDVLETEE